jgi:hypothetical protein
VNVARDDVRHEALGEHAFRHAEPDGAVAEIEDDAALAGEIDLFPDLASRRIRDGGAGSAL